MLAEHVRRNDLASAAELLREGVDPNARDPLGYTPLIVASGLGHRQMVEMLLTAGADARRITSISRRTTIRHLSRPAPSVRPQAKENN